MVNQFLNMAWRLLRKTTIFDGVSLHFGNETNEFFFKCKFVLIASSHVVY